MKKTIFFAFAILTAAAAFSREEPTAPKALLWIPEEGSGWEETLVALSSRPDFHLTIAVSSATQAGLSMLKSLVSKGQVETAMRLSGDPVLPVLFYPNNPGVKWKNRNEAAQWSDRPDEMVSRLSTARDKHVRFFREQPAGWAPEAGGIIPDMLPAVKALGIKWTASGPVSYSSACAGVSASGEIQIVPFALADSSSSFDCQESTGPCFLALDETLGKKSGTRDLLISLASGTASSRAGWLTVSEAIAASSGSPCSVETATAAVLSPWTGDYSPWAGSPEQYAALTNLNKTRQALDSYITSGQAGPRTVKILSEEFMDMESGSRFMRLAGTSPEDAGEAELEFQSGLSGIYRQIGKPIPASIFRPLAEVAASETASVSSARPVMQSGPSWITIQNPDKQLIIPRQAASLPQGADPSKIWKLNSISLNWDDNSLKIMIRPAQTDNAGNAPGGFSHILADIYMDMNHRQGSGISSFLSGRKARTSPEDAWEYAVVIHGWKASLFKASPRGPVLTGSFMPRLDPSSGEISVEIPREKIKGNPLLWGYVAAVMALKNHEEPEASPVSAASEDAIIDAVSSERIRDSFYALRLR